MMKEAKMNNWTVATCSMSQILPKGSGGTCSSKGNTQEIKRFTVGISGKTVYDTYKSCSKIFNDWKGNNFDCGRVAVFKYKVGGISESCKFYKVCAICVGN